MVRKPKTPPVTFTRICAVSAESVYVSCSPDKNEALDKFTILSQFHKGEWSYQNFDFALQSMNLAYDPKIDARVLYLLSWTGDLVNLHTMKRTLVPPPELQAQLKEKYTLGYMSKIQQIGSHLYAIGQGGQNYRCDNDGNWRVLDMEIFDPCAPSPTWPYDLLPQGTYYSDGSPEMNAFFADKPDLLKEYERRKNIFFRNSILNDIAGLAENDMYVCGSRGILLHWNSETFKKIEVPYEPFTSIYIEDPEQVWIASRDGRVMKGNARKGFDSIIELSKAFTKITKFKGVFYMVSIAQPCGLFAYDRKKFWQVSCGLQPDLDDVSALSVCDDVLWVMGLKDLLRFDGATWERIHHPLNPPRR